MELSRNTLEKLFLIGIHGTSLNKGENMEGIKRY